MIHQLSIDQYSEKLGVSRQAILYRIDNGLTLPGVKQFAKVGRAYVLSFNDKVDIEEAKKSFNNSSKRVK